ncbi:unnamed protein product [Pleuronectes platessa]|uniref:Uncharacterized protein n=1 Tax=Pleuronectes platessa TaxID=8262 RepID=A0A9N7TYK1_PLEPL|nr:unnamed protein product [Pleuronectes platessa]
MDVLREHMEDALETVRGKSWFLYGTKAKHLHWTHKATSVCASVSVSVPLPVSVSIHTVGTILALCSRLCATSAQTHTSWPGPLRPRRVARQRLSGPIMENNTHNEDIH